MIEFYCQGCGEKLSAPEEYAGGKGKCSKCGAIHIVPEAGSAPEVAPSPARSVPVSQSRVTDVVPSATTARAASADVLWSGQPSPWAFLGNYIMAAILVVGAAVLAFALWQTSSTGSIVILLAGLVLGGFILIAAVVQQRCTHFEVTSDRIIWRWRFLGRESKEIPMHSVRESRVFQGLFDRMFGIGQVQFSSASTSDVEITFRGASDPDTVKEIVVEASSKAGTRRPD